MVRCLKILILLLLTKSPSWGQINSSSKVFHKHFQTCDFIESTDNYFIIVLNNDSNVEITKYNLKFRDQSNIITRQTYVGIYSTNGDTVKIKFTDHSSTTKRKINQTKAAPFPINEKTALNGDIVFQYPCTTFIISGDKITAVDGKFPTLNKSTSIDILLLESNFINSDRSIFYGKEIIGVSK